MARRGLQDIAAQTGKLPLSLDAVEEAGAVPYYFPAGFEPELVDLGSEVELNSGGRPLYSLGRLVEPIPYRAAIPEPGLCSFMTWFAPSESDPSQREEQQLLIWHFRGAEWLEEGFGWNEVAVALRRDRVAAFLIAASMEFAADNSSMPRDLQELEEYVGLTRIPEAWADLHQVSLLGQTEYEQGALYVGWDNDAWIVSCNLGPEVYLERFVLDDSGAWAFTQHSSFAY